MERHETLSRIFHAVFDHIRHDPTPKTVQVERESDEGQLELDFYAEADIEYITACRSLGRVGASSGQSDSPIVSPPYNELNVT